jgi:ribosomal subunit interface protein
MVRRLFRTGMQKERRQTAQLLVDGARVGAMKVRVSGKQIEIGEALPEQVRSRIESAIGKYILGGGEAHVVFAHEGTGFRCDCAAHLDSGVVLKAQGGGVDAHRAFDAALHHLEKQVRRYKRRLKNHHEKTVPRGNAGT